MNFFTDAIFQPVITAIIEGAMWYAIFSGLTIDNINGFTREYYFAYAIWAAFFARISANWMYEFRMLDEVETGTINSVLVRPISFFEYYLGQFMGYKILTAGFSLILPALAFSFIDTPTQFARFPLVLLLSLYYLLFVYTISFCMASLAFFFTRVHSFTVAKNFTLWILSGELFPLDIVPEPYRSVVIQLPFANAVYVPVGYLTGRIGVEQVYYGFASTTVGILVFGLIGFILWSWGRRIYSGVGA